MHATCSFAPVATVDVCGYPCPAPVVTARRHARQLEAGGVLMLVADCVRTTDELATWARATGNELLYVEPLDERRRGYYIRKGLFRSVQRVVDTRGSRCPTPVIEAGRALRGLACGEIIHVISDCPSARIDVISWTRSTGHILLDAVENLHGELHCYVQKR